jgi:hypothetical protein
LKVSSEQRTTVTELSQEELGRNRIRLSISLNITSLNFVYEIYEIYDGDGSAFGISGPPGPAEVEKLSKDYFKNDVDSITKPSELTAARIMIFSSIFFIAAFQRRKDA